MSPERRTGDIRGAPPARRGAALAAVGVLVVLALGAWVVLRSEASFGRSDAPPAAAGEERRAGGIPGRPHDPAEAPVGWRDPDVDPGAVQRALDAALPAWDLLAHDLDANAEIVGWFDSLVDDGPFGEAIAACRHRYERMQPRLCRWQQDLVLRREQDGAARVVAVRARLASDLADPLLEAGDPTPSCRAWASCVADAWKHRTGRFPILPDDLLAADATGETFLAVTAPVHHIEAHGLAPEDYEEAYRRRIDEIRKRIEAREAYLAEVENEGGRSRRAIDAIYQSLLLERAWLEDYQRYLRHLQAAEP